MADNDEKELAKIARRLLAMPPKKREESKIGKTKDSQCKQIKKSVLRKRAK